MGNIPLVDIVEIGAVGVDDEILEFLLQAKTNDSIIQLLASTDVAVMRIVEDFLVGLLFIIMKNRIWWSRQDHFRRVFGIQLKIS